MAFYNPFPATYQNSYYQQPQMQQQIPVQTMTQPIQQPQQQPQVSQSQPPMNSNLIWVSGEAGAKAYLVAPNTTVQLWDSEAQVIYLKSADASGMPSIKTLDYTIRAENQPMQTLQHVDTNYISREEFNSLESKINALQSEINKLKPRNDSKKENKHNG